MSTIKTTNITHGSNSGTANMVLSSAGNVEARKVNGCQRIVLEQFYHICDGSTIATSAGNITLPNCTAVLNTGQSWVDVTGSSISYQPPSGTTMVMYELNFKQQSNNAFAIVCYTFYIDSDEITNQRTVIGGNEYVDSLQTFKIGIPIGGTASTTTGRVASWSSAKTLKLQVQGHHSSNNGVVHGNNFWVGASNDDSFHQPSIGITAIG